MNRHPELLHVLRRDVLSSRRCFAIALVGFFFMQVSPAGAKTLAYVTLENDAMRVIDTATNGTIDTITLGLPLEPADATLVVTPNGEQIYVGVPGRNFTLAFKTSINAVAGFLVHASEWQPQDTAFHPAVASEVAMSPDGSLVGILENNVSSNGEFGSGLVEVFETRTNQGVGGTATALQGHGDWTSMAFSPNGKLYVGRSDASSSTLAIVDPLAGEANDTSVALPVANLTGIAFSPNGSVAYLLSNGGLAVFETATNSIIKTISMEARAIDVVFTSSGGRAYVTTAPHGLSVIDTALQKEIAAVSFLNATAGLAITPDDKFVYVALAKEDRRDPGVAVIDTATNKQVATALQDGDPLSPTHIVIAAVPSPSAPQPCTGDQNGDGHVTIDEVITSVSNVLNGCRMP